MIPDFSQLSLEPTVSTQPTSLELPQDLWERILGVLDTYNPYDEIVKLCAINREWASWCRSGWLYDAANRAIGWYGKHETWDEVLAVYAGLKYDPPGDGTPKAYFQEACRSMQSPLDEIAPWHPFYVPVLKRRMAIPYHGEWYGRRWHRLSPITNNDRPFYNSMAKVPTYLPEYEDIAMVAVLANPGQLEGVLGSMQGFLDHNGAQLHNGNHPWCNFLNRKLPGYWKIAQAAVRKEPRAIVWVPFTYSGYLRLAEAALAEYHYSKGAHFPRTSDNRTCTWSGLLPGSEERRRVRHEGRHDDHAEQCARPRDRAWTPSVVGRRQLRFGVHLRSRGRAHCSA